MNRKRHEESELEGLAARWDGASIPDDDDDAVDDDGDDEGDNDDDNEISLLPARLRSMRSKQDVACSYG